MKKYKITIIVIVIIIFLLGWVVYISHKNNQTNNQTVKQAAPTGPQWINVDKKLLPLNFPNIPVLTRDAVSVDRYYVEQKEVNKKAIKTIHGEYSYTIANSKVPLKLTAQGFYAKILGMKTKAKNIVNWTMTEGVSSIDAIQGGDTVHIDFVDNAQAGTTTINIIYTYAQ